MIDQHELEYRTAGRGCTEITSDLRRCVTASGIERGLCHVYLLHTSASLMTCENADPQVLADLEGFLARLVPDGDPSFAHDAEGPDDMPAHVRSVLTQTELSIPVRNRALVLGTWQGVYLYEHRARTHHRRVLVTLHG